MNKLLVIADDLSGAAEIAGLALRYGLPAQLSRQPIGRGVPAGVTVIDTDSRTLPPPLPAETVLRFVHQLHADEFDLIYKKTDSVLRGPVRFELEALADHFNCPRVLLVPQNPSRGRTISAAGRYEIGGVPLHQTAFADDPEHPARTAAVSDILGDAVPHAICLAPGAGLTDCRLAIGAGDCVAHLDHWAALATASRQVLPAGGAEFFEAILRHAGHRADRTRANHDLGGSRLFVCGSASSYTEELLRRARDAGIPICPMSDDIVAWAEQVIATLGTTGRALMLIARPLDRAVGAPQRFQSAIAHAVAVVLSKICPALLLLEGGATAAAVCRRMGWNDFPVAGEQAPGIVQLKVISGVAAPDLLIKPGSYAWPDVVWMPAPAPR